MTIYLNAQRILPRVIGNVEPIGFLLTDNPGEVPADLSGKTFTVRLANIATGTAAASAGTVTLIDAATGEVSWTPHADDVDAAGRFAVYVVDNSSQPRRWPFDGAKFQLHVMAENQTNV